MEGKLAAAPVRLALEVALFTKIEAETWTRLWVEKYSGKTRSACPGTC